jgi:hypothetical protein
VIIFTELCFVFFSSTRCLNHHSSRASTVKGYVLSLNLGTWGYVKWDEMEWTVLILYWRWIKWLNWIVVFGLLFSNLNCCFVFLAAARLTSTEFLSRLNTLFAFVFVAAAGLQSSVCVPAAWAVVWVAARSLPAQGIFRIRTPALARTPLRCWPAAKSTNQCTVAHLSRVLCCLVKSIVKSMVVPQKLLTSVKLHTCRGCCVVLCSLLWKSG